MNTGRKNFVATWGIGFGLLAVAVGVAIFASGLWASWASAILAMVAAIWIGAAWMGSVDEAAQEAHKWSWYWGGCIGMAIGGVLLILATTPASQHWTVPVAPGHEGDPVAYAATGALGLLGLMLVGYLVAWGLWWLRRR